MVYLERIWLIYPGSAVPGTGGWVIGRRLYSQTDTLPGSANGRETRMCWRGLPNDGGTGRVRSWLESCGSGRFGLFSGDDVVNHVAFFDAGEALIQSHESEREGFVIDA